jgi:hypothetical protein
MKKHRNPPGGFVTPPFFPPGQTWITHIPKVNPKKGKARKKNPDYRARFTAPGDVGSVRKALKGAGYTDVRVRGGEKRKPGPYALFVKAQMPKLVASGMSVGDAMREAAALWKAKSNPSRGHRMAEVAAYVGQHPGVRMLEVAEAVGPHGSRRYGYASVHRAVKGGHVRAEKDSRGRYSMYPKANPYMKFRFLNEDGAVLVVLPGRERNGMVPVLSRAEGHNTADPEYLRGLPRASAALRAAGEKLLRDAGYAVAQTLGNPASAKAKAKYFSLVAAGDFAGAARTLKHIHAGVKGSAKGSKANPYYRANPYWQANPASGPWKSMAEIRAAHDGYFFKNRPRRGSETERQSTIKGPYRGRYIVVPKETKLSNGWAKQGAVYRVEDDGRIRHVETLWGLGAWERAIDLAKSMEP